MPRLESPPPVRHALSDAAFAALGAGRPDPATIAELRNSQLSRNLLLLRGIIAAAPTTTRRWYGQLTAADHTNPTGTRRLLADPLCGVWAADCLTALRNGTPPADAGLDRLADLAATATELAGQHAVDPAARPRRPRPEQSHPASGRNPARTLLADQDGLTIRVRLEDADPLRGRLGLPPTGPLSDAEFAHWQRCLTAAWRLLVTRHRPAAEVLAAVLQVIVPVEPDPAAGGISATSAHAFGAVAMSAPPDGAALAVGLLHETQHSLLNAVHHLFDLHVNPNTLGYSPWRDDPRPVSGTLHGAYAYLAVTRFWRTEATADRHPEARHAKATAGALAEFEFARWRAAVAAVATDLLAAGGLTRAGIRFVGALHAEVTPWLAEPLTPEVARLAADANTDHHLRWRLRHLVVAPAAATAFAGAWLRGLPAPPRDELATHLRPASGRALENSTRLSLIHRHLRTRADLGSAADPHVTLPDGGTAVGDETGVGDSGAGGAVRAVSGQVARRRAAAGDAAYLRGDYGTAVNAYREAVELDPGDEAAWTGLAVVCGVPGLRERPEAVAAIYRALAADDAAKGAGGAGAGVDPIAVARWVFP